MNIEQRVSRMKEKIKVNQAPETLDEMLKSNAGESR